MSIGRVPGTTGIQPSIVDAKGDLIVATAADSVDRLAVGSANQVLTVDSSTATGLKWAATQNPTFVGCGIYNSGNVSANNNTDTAFTCDSEFFDSDNFHSTTSNTDRITIPSGKGGKYLFTASLQWASNATGARIAEFYKNGSYLIASAVVPINGAQTWQIVTGIANLSAGDYVTLLGYQTSGGALNMLGGASYTNIFCTYLGA